MSKSANLYLIAANSVQFSTGFQYKTFTDGSGNIYHCTAVPGTAETKKEWRVIQEDTAGNTRFRVYLPADGGDTKPSSAYVFNAEDSDLTGATYSFS